MNNIESELKRIETILSEEGIEIVAKSKRFKSLNTNVYINGIGTLKKSRPIMLPRSTDLKKYKTDLNKMQYSEKFCESCIGYSIIELRKNGTIVTGFSLCSANEEGGFNRKTGYLKALVDAIRLNNRLVDSGYASFGKLSV